MEIPSGAASTVYDGAVARERILIRMALVSGVGAALALSFLPGEASFPVQAALAAAAVAAFLCGSLGLGFGALLVPALILLDVDPRVAVASSLISQLVIVPIGGLSHASFGHVRARVVAPLLAAGFVGTVAGAQFSLRISESLLMSFIAISTVLMGALLLAREIPEARWSKVHDHVPWATFLFIGLIAGFTAAAFGTGWGPVGVSLLLLLGTTPKLAIGSSVTARAPIALSATVSYLLLAGPQKVVELAVLLPIIAGGIFGILVGSVATRRLRDAHLHRAVGAAVIALGLLVLLKV